MDRHREKERLEEGWMQKAIKRETEVGVRIKQRRNTKTGTQRDNQEEGQKVIHEDEQTERDRQGKGGTGEETEEHLEG